MMPRPALIILGFALLLSLPLSLPLGAISLPIDAIWHSVRDSAVSHPKVSLILWELRLPRALLAACAGSALALAGLIMQTLLRNPLADPFIVGVSSGASLGAIAVLLLDIGLWLGAYRLPLAGFTGSLFSLVMIWLIARHSHDHLRLVLCGVALSFFYAALGSLLILQWADHGLDAIYFWQQGSVADAQWFSVVTLLITVVICSAILFRHQDTLNSLLLGEKKAASLGVNLYRVRWLLLLLAALLTGVSVAFCGVVGFVGLIIPHCCRLLFGDNHRVLLPASIMLGATYMLWVDALCRWLLAPEELALSIMTALSAVPFFLYLVLRRVND